MQGIYQTMLAQQQAAQNQLMEGIKAEFVRIREETATQQRIAAAQQADALRGGGFDVEGKDDKEKITCLGKLKTGRPEKYLGDRVKFQLWFHSLGTWCRKGLSVGPEVP